LDGPLPKLCPAIALSHQDDSHSTVALLLKAALIQVSDYRLLGASGLPNLQLNIGKKYLKTAMIIDESLIQSYVKLSTAVQPLWSEGGTTRHNFGKGPFNDYFIKVWFQLSNWFQTRRFVCEYW
jgi:hypothetical protein